MMLDAEGACLSPNSKPHICEHCNAAFRSSYHLRRHVLIHTGERLSLLVSAFFGTLEVNKSEVTTSINSLDIV